MAKTYVLHPGTGTYMDMSEVKIIRVRDDVAWMMEDLLNGRTVDGSVPREEIEGYDAEGYLPFSIEGWE